VAGWRVTSTPLLLLTAFTAEDAERAEKNRIPVASELASDVRVANTASDTTSAKTSETSSDATV